MPRSLAKLVRLGTVIKHPNADRLQVAQIGGWEVVVGLDSREGDQGVYFEIDSVLPKAEWTAGLPSLKIKSLRLRGVLSQGLFVPYNDVPPLRDTKFEDDKEVTELLGVEKRFDPQDLPEGVSSSNGNSTCMYNNALPEGPPKTDEPRIQSNKKLLEYLRGRPYYASVKYDGSSATYAYVDGFFTVLSRNFVVDKKDSTFWYIANKYGLAEKLKNTPFIVQGEMIGPKIQGNPLQLNDPELRVFNVYNILEHRYLQFDELVQALDNLNSTVTGQPLQMVQVLNQGDSFDLDIKALLAMAEGYYENTRKHREGIVVRSQSAPRVSFKVINNTFLIKKGE